MVKFGKYFLHHRVSEWSDFYLRYKTLKKLLKRIQPKEDSDGEDDDDERVERRALREAALPEPAPARSRPRANTGDIELAGPELGKGEPASAPSFSSDFTAFLRHLPRDICGDPMELEFFSVFYRDYELIQEFYSRQEQFFLHKVDLLSKQVYALYMHRKRELKAKKEAEKNRKRQTQNNENNIEENHEDESPESKDSTSDSAAGTGSSSSVPSVSTDQSISFTLNTRINGTKWSYSKNKTLLHKSLRELYRGLQLLKNYRILNYTAFVKILKKHDKVTSMGALPALTPLIRATPFYYSPVLDQCIARTENIFISFFHHGDRKKAMESLRVTRPPTSPWQLFRIGVLMGISAGANW